MRRLTFLLTFSLKGNIMLEKIKTHFTENKKFYIGVGIGAGVATAGYLILNSQGIKIEVFGDNNHVVGKAREVNQVIINLVERSTPSKPVHLVGTNLYFNSLSEAARETGHSLSRISKNVNGHIPDVGGDVFELLDLAS